MQHDKNANRGAHKAGKGDGVLSTSPAIAPTTELDRITDPPTAPMPWIQKMVDRQRAGYHQREPQRKTEKAHALRLVAGRAVLPESLMTFAIAENSRRDRHHGGVARQRIILGGHA